MVAMELTHSPVLSPGQQLLLTTKLKGKHVNQLWMKVLGKTSAGELFTAHMS